MFRNYLIVAYRNLWKDKKTSALNIIALAIGITCCMLILIYIKDELSFNTGNANLKNIYRVNWTSTAFGEITPMASTPVPLAKAIESEMPQVKYVTHMYQRSGAMQLLKANGASDKLFQEQNVQFADDKLFKIFTIPFVSGNSTDPLSAPGSIVITDEMAKKYFDVQDPIGKILLYDTKVPLKVTAVVKKMPANSDLTFDFLISFETLFSAEDKNTADFIRNDWTFNPASTYCLLSEGQTINSANTQLANILKKYGDERKNIHSMSLQPLKDIHLYAADIQGNPSTSSISYIYIFSAIAFLILVIANVNFINLATARAGTRAREVGMRKVLGAEKKQLIMQFLGETILISMIALVLAMLFTNFSLPLLNSLTNKHLSASNWFQPLTIILFILVFLTTGILSGLYPAFFITRFDPILAMKGKSGEVRQRNFSRRVLLVMQFSISIVLIVGSIVIFKQLEYIRNKPLGFKKEHMLVIPIFGSGASSIGYGVDGPMRKRMNTFAEELKKFSKIKDVTAASTLPGQGSVFGLVIPEGHKESDNIFIPWISVDYNFLETFEIPLVEGRTFSKSTGTDHLQAFLINESAVRSFGWKDAKSAIGKTIVRGKESDGKHGQVIGVIKDYNFSTLDQPMQAQIIDVNVPRFTQLAVSIQNDDANSSIAFIEKQWKEFFPERVFEYSFLDRDIQNLYRDKENLSRIIEYFALIAVLLSCSGLFSLASFIAMQRTKEIGIRKVLGANVSTLLILLSRDFVRLVLIAIIIASPIAYYLMHKWLENYAYKIDMKWWMFVLAGSLVLLLTVLTVGLQSIKAALANPIKNLRTE